MAREQARKRVTSVLGLETPGTWTVGKQEVLGKKYKYFTEYTGKFSDLLAWYKTSPKPEAENKSSNASFYTEQVYKSDDRGWKGGNFKDMLLPVGNLEEFHRLENEISSNKVWKNLATQLGSASVRRRVRDRFDGEWDLDKKWDMEPFTKRSTAMQARKIVRINCESSFSAYVPAKDIDRYGAFVTAVVSLLEKSGTTVELWANYTAEGHAGSNDDSGFKFMIKIKDASEYMPVQSILRTLSSVWYRRAIFGLIVQAGEALGKSTSMGLGRPKSFGVPWEIKDNCLNIYSVPSIKEQASITENLLKLVGK